MSDSVLPQAHQAPLSLGFSRQEHWSGLPLPSLKMLLLNRKMKGCNAQERKSTWSQALDTMPNAPSVTTVRGCVTPGLALNEKHHK